MLMIGLDSYYTRTSMCVFPIRPTLLKVAFVMVTTITTLSGCVWCGVWLGRTLWLLAKHQCIYSAAVRFTPLSHFARSSFLVLAPLRPYLGDPIISAVWSILQLSLVSLAVILPFSPSSWSVFVKLSFCSHGLSDLPLFAYHFYIS